MFHYQAVYETLVSWCKRSNKETRANAFSALEAFLKQVCEKEFDMLPGLVGIYIKYASIFERLQNVLSVEEVRLPFMIGKYLRYERSCKM